MKKSFLLVSIAMVCIAGLIFVSCKHETTCETMRFNLTIEEKRNPTTDSTDGFIKAKASGGDNITFQLVEPDGNVQNDPKGLFESLDSGTYTITARNAQGCTSSIKVTLSKNQPGPQFAAMYQLVKTYCSSGRSDLRDTSTSKGCHMNDTQNDYNFNRYIDVVNNWDIIYKRCVTLESGTIDPIDGDPKLMPIVYDGPNSNPFGFQQLDSIQLSIIKNWVNGGHSYSN